MSKFWDNILKFFACGSSAAIESDDIIISDIMDNIEQYNQKPKPTPPNQHKKMTSYSNNYLNKPADSLIENGKKLANNAPPIPRKTLMQKAIEAEESAQEFYKNAMKLKNHYKHEKKVVDKAFHDMSESTIGKIIEPISVAFTGQNIFAEEQDL